MNRPMLVILRSCILTLALSVAYAVSGADFATLHSFAGGPNDGGSGIVGGVTLSGSTVYGATGGGGANGHGTVFRMNTDGSAFSILHSFTGTFPDGNDPMGDLLQTGSTLFGITHYGGYGLGTIFRMNTNGSGFTVLHSFFGGNNDGGYPWSGLVASGSVLFGTTSEGGGAERGTVYKINTDGTGFQLLHAFDLSDGSELRTNLTLVGDTLYGTTLEGGAGTVGTIFKIRTDGSGFQTLRSFDFTFEGAGYHPAAAVTVAGSTIYGVLGSGGLYDAGTLFKMNIDGSGFSVIHHFTGGTGGGAPISQLILDGSQLYGATTNGAFDGGQGCVFRIGTGGSNFTVLHGFIDALSVGGPFGDLALADSVLYGMTDTGGDSHLGSVFALAVPEPSGFLLAALGVVVLGFRWRRGWRAALERHWPT